MLIDVTAAVGLAEAADGEDVTAVGVALGSGALVVAMGDGESVGLTGGIGVGRSSGVDDSEPRGDGELGRGDAEVDDSTGA